MQILFENASLFRAEPDRPVVEPRMSVLVSAKGRIEWVGDQGRVPRELLAEHEQLDLDGKLLTPGLIECHTHLVWGGSREKEFVRRLGGATYEELLLAGGGIHQTVADTRAASSGALFEAAIPRLEAFRQQGVTTLEVKSGYGLTFDDELRMLEVIRDFDEKTTLDVIPTLLAAHAVPVEFKDDRTAYLDMVCGRLIPEVAKRRLAVAVDAFCDTGGFSLAETRRVFEAAKAAGLPVRVHAEQLTRTGAAKLAAEFSAFSADHLEHLDAEGIAAMREAGTVAVLLPYANLSLKSRIPPVKALRDAKVPVAISTDCNPGSSHTTNLHLMIALACHLYGMTPGEALLGVTAHAARALGLEARIGRIAPGLDADLCVWDCNTLGAIPYNFGSNLILHAWKRGRPAL
jgi:imidazolonepropionase